MSKYISWEVKKIGQWFYCYFSPKLINETYKSLQSHLHDKNILFLKNIAWLEFEKEFTKLKIEFKSYNKTKTDLKCAIISATDLSIVRDENKYYQYCFIEIPSNYSEESIQNIPNIDYTEDQTIYEHGKIISALEKVDSTLLYNNVDGPYCNVFCKGNKFVDSYLIALFNNITKDLDDAIKSKFTDQIILKIMYYSSDYNHLTNSFTMDSSGQINCQLWKNKNYDEDTKVCNITIVGGVVTFSDWEDKEYKDAPYYSEEDGSGCMIILAVISVIIAGLYFLIKFIIGLF